MLSFDDRRHVFVVRKGGSSFLERIGLVSMSSSGFYASSPLFNLYRSAIESVLRRMLEEIGLQEVSLPYLQGTSLWDMTGRWDNWSRKDLFMVQARGEEMMLMPTAEEAMFCTLCRDFYLPEGSDGMGAFQIGKKFRNEIRCRGMLRTREFDMLDIYILSKDRAVARRNFFTLFRCFLDVFKVADLKVEVACSEDVSMGDSRSYEFFLPSRLGEGKYRRVGRKNELGLAHHYVESKFGDVTGVELGHVFDFGRFYSKALGSERHSHWLFSSYGIGLTRMIEMLCLRHGGPIWPDGFLHFVVVGRGVNDSESLGAWSGLNDIGLKVMLVNCKGHVNENFRLSRRFFRNVSRIILKGDEVILQKVLFTNDIRST